MERIRALWAEHVAAPFPLPHDDSEATEVGNIDLDLLDSGTAGCVLAFLDNGGHLDLWRTAILGLCYGDLCIVAPALTGGPRVYFERLREIARLVLEAVCEGAGKGRADAQDAG